jgi:hypothetical protein
MSEDFLEIRKPLMLRHSALKTERSSWMPHWEGLSSRILPRSGRFISSDRNRGGDRHNNILDSTGTRALRILAAGMLAGMTSPARPWFRLAIKDTDLNDFDPVKRWLSLTTTVMQSVFARSNTYRSLHTMYEELGCFGTASSVMIDDFETVTHHFPLTIGEYCLATNWKGQVDTIYREFERPVGEVVGEFGLANVSQTLRDLYERGDLQSWVPIIHVIEPRRERDLKKRDVRNMPWKSCYFERDGLPDRYLRESGFSQFPVLAPRWHVTGGDIYGQSPAMEAYGDAGQLQHQQLRKGQAIDYQTNPPLQVPLALKNREVERLPGGVTYVDSAGASQAIKSMFDVQLNLQHLREDTLDVRDRINQAFSVDVLLMISNADKTGMTATEVAERHEEKMLMLGPVLERLHNEMLSPMIERTFERMLAAGIVPPPPPELNGVDLDVDFVSMLAQAQRAIGVNSMDRFVGNLGAVATMKPEVLDNFDADEWADLYADKLGIDPKLIVPSDRVALIRESRAEAEAKRAEMEANNMQADTANKLAGAKTTEPSVMTDLLNQFSGYGSPTGTEV